MIWLLATKSEVSFYDCIYIPLLIFCSLWKENDSYQKLQKVVAGLVIINDDTERGCNLLTTHGGTLTRDEDNQQGIFQAITKREMAIMKEAHPDYSFFTQVFVCF